MNKEEQIKAVRELNKIVHIGLYSAKRTLEKCNWDMDKAIKYAKYFPYTTPMDYWVKRKYCYCSKCDRFYVVDINCSECKCGNKF